MGHEHATAWLCAAIACLIAAPLGAQPPPNPPVVVDLDAAEPAAPTDETTEPSEDPKRPEFRPHVLGIEANLEDAAGIAFTDGLANGGFVRLTAEAQLGSVPYAQPLYPVFSYSFGLEGWTTGFDLGVGLPITLHGGVRLGPARGNPIMATVRGYLGSYLFHLDVVDNVAGGGILAPVAGADLALGSEWIQAGGGVQVSYRWEWALDDRVQILFGGQLTVRLVHDRTSP